MSRMRDAERLVAHAVRQGFKTKRTTKGWVVYSKDGQTSALIHLTPSDCRGLKNDKARLKRMGVEIP